MSTKKRTPLPADLEASLGKQLVLGCILKALRAPKVLVHEYGTSSALLPAVLPRLSIESVGVAGRLAFILSKPSELPSNDFSQSESPPNLEPDLLRPRKCVFAASAG